MKDFEDIACVEESIYSESYKKSFLDEFPQQFKKGFVGGIKIGIDEGIKFKEIKRFGKRSTKEDPLGGL
ncbi:hypothetical protein MXB_282 [Myxobolus squamalis]|nr:hypothetical protein MXB_282 [Myxobolus squamalis]